MKRIALLLAVVFVAAACSEAVETQQPAVDSTQAATVPEAVTDDEPTATRDSMGDAGASLVPNETIAPKASDTPEGLDAPDFTLALGDGSSFTLSEESQPVYMIFWADW